MQHRPRDILLVGSFAAPTAEAVFRTVSKALGNRVRRIPDGETGDRSQWIRWQVFAFRDNPSFMLDQNLKGSDYQTDFYMLQPGMTARDVRYGPLGYAENALASYAVFSRLKDEGVVAPDCRLQISIPPPYNVLDRHVSPRDRLAAEVGYERKMLAEIDEIVAAVPKQELAIQWDAAHEVQNSRRSPRGLVRQSRTGGSGDYRSLGSARGPHSGERGTRVPPLLWRFRPSPRGRAEGHWPYGPAHQQAIRTGTPLNPVDSHAGTAGSLRRCVFRSAP